MVPRLMRSVTIAAAASATLGSHTSFPDHTSM
jgi:hypothetical protein